MHQLYFLYSKERLRKKDIVNGFKATGLFPFDAKNVKYSKCIQSREVENVQSGVRKEHYNSHSFLDNLETRIELEVLGEFRNVPDGMQWEGVESTNILFDLWRQARIEATVRNIEPEADQNRPTNLDSVNLSVESTNPYPINGILF